MTTERSLLKTIARWALGVFLVIAGIGHLGPQRSEFQAQVPSWVPIDPDIVVVASGLVELSLGAALIFAGRRAALVGVIVAGFFIVIFPGNVAQFVEGTNAFGLDSDSQRLVRLWFQPLLVIWALWSTGGWGWLRHRFGAEHPMG
ncbi:MAG: DoxX family membrane protein [Acidimicrobiia bacterium]|nr:DoxX family membrane protein [Acidimicrobiia bacterium]